MKTGPDGKPHISEFGNVKQGRVDGEQSVGPVVKDAREPLVDVMDAEKEIIVIAELPGVEKTDIDLLSDCIDRLQGSKEFFINKAIGWILREYSKSDSDWVINFVENRKLANLSKREALKWLNRKQIEN